jgi:hypothetical protein
LAGWVTFPMHTVPKMTWEPTAIAVGAGALVLLIAVAHGLARWLYGHFNADSPQPRRWQFGWSVSIVGIVVLLFGCGICIIVTIHEVGWIVKSDEPIITMAGREAARRISSNNQLKQIGLGIHNYGTANKRLPPGGTFNRYGEMQHSWETMLLPHMEHGEIKPDMTLPWNHPNNAKHFKIVLRDFINPGIKGIHQVDSDGYGLSHYTVNLRVMGPNYSVRQEDVTDGPSNTILGGEVNDRFQPWGHPVNWRDPALGINKSPDGFGGPWASHGANIVLMDASVRFMNETIDPAILRALSTPNGGEKVEIPD